MLFFFEDLYYFMGKVVYDILIEKQLNENVNIYYIEMEDCFKYFLKMNIYGLMYLLINNV